MFIYKILPKYLMLCNNKHLFKKLSQIRYGLSQFVDKPNQKGKHVN